IRSPLCTSVYWARQCRQARESREAGSDYWQDDHWEQLFDQDMPICDMALHALVYGLVVASSEARRVAIDALIQCIYDGRLDGRMIGTVIADHYMDLPMERWLDALREASALSPLHQQVMHEAMEMIVSALDLGAPSDTALPFLEELYELSVITEH